MNNACKTPETEKPSLVQRILTPIVVLLIMLVIVELFLQIFMPLPFSDRLYWVPDGHVKARLEPNQPVVNTDGNNVYINRLGFRGPEWTWKPASGTLRLVALGGSAAFCFQVSDDEHTWTAQLERLLEERLGMPVEVANLGLPGYDLSNSKINYLFSGRALHPHAVLVYHTWNDMKFFRPLDENDGTPWSVLSGRAAIGTNRSVLTRLFRRLQIVRRIERVTTRMRHTDRENRYTSLEKEGERAHAPVGKRAWKWFEENFADIVAFAKRDGVLPVLISQATLAHPDNMDDKACRLVISNDFVGMTLSRLAESWRRASEIVERVATDTDTLFVDGYNAVPHDLKNFKDHVHLWDAGALRLAEAIADALLGDGRFMQLADEVRRGEDQRR